ncbi:MAG: hypothetical protein WA980_23800 [Shinella zoogloeoides]|uniref:hypothetical protein n=1 Tax=Shinella zoogloeoides TaxID=352475 RepID=UPI003C7401E9
MNRTVTIALASLLAVSTVAGVAYAQQGMDADRMTTGSIGTDNVSVVQMSTLEMDQSQRGEFDRLSHRMNDPASVERVQAELQSNPDLTALLASKNVQLNNVVEIKTAADGSKIVYVR